MILKLMNKKVLAVIVKMRKSERNKKFSRKHPCKIKIVQK